MGDRGNIAVIQSEDKQEQVWFYGHWSGWRMPAVLQHAIKEGKGRWNDPTYFARVVFCRLLAPGPHYWDCTSYGIGTRIGDNQHPIMVADCSEQIVYQIEEKQLKDGRVPADFKPDKYWTFGEYEVLNKLPWGATLEQHLVEIGKIGAKSTSPELLEACRRALPWIGKMIADNGHMHAVAPNDCVGAMQQLESAITKATLCGIT